MKEEYYRDIFGGTKYGDYMVQMNLNLNIAVILTQ